MNRWTRSLRIPASLQRWIDTVRATVNYWAERCCRLHAACLMLAQTRRRPRTVLILENLENRELLNATPTPFPTDTTTSSLAVVNNDQVSQSNVPTLIVLENQYDTARNALAAAWQPWLQTFVRFELAAFGMAQQEFNTLRHDADTLLDDLGIHLLDQSSSSSASDGQQPHDPIFTVHPISGPKIGDPSIAAVEGVAWYGAVATISDNDGDDSSDQNENITGTIDWGDGSPITPFNNVPENGSLTLDLGHTWTEKGAYTVVVTANDPDGGSSQVSETANVADGQLSWEQSSNAPNYPPSWSQTFDAAPTIYAPASQTNTEGDTVSLPVQASDSDGQSLSYDALDLPPGLSINSSTGVISGTVAYGAAEDFDGSYNPTIIVADGQGGSNQVSFAWNINQAQIAPVLTSPSNQTNLRGDDVSLQLNTTQVDNDPLTFAASNLPPGLSIDPDTGLLSGTVDPSVALGTPYVVTVTATDDSTNLNSSQTFNWTINATNVAPVLTSPGNQSNAAGDQVSLQLSATDADGDSLTYTATGLPPGLTLDPITGIISGTFPNSAASGTPYNVTVMASDGMASSSQSFTWTVNGISLQNPGDQGNLDGDNVSLQLTATDTNNGTLSYSASGLPAGLTINSTTGLISGTLANTDDTSSPYAVTVTATDGTNNASQSFNWTVARLALNDPSDQENQEGTTISLQLSATDHVGTPTYSAAGLPPGLSINSTTGLISGNVGLGSYGSSPYQTTVTATDGTSTSSQSFVWTVTPRVALVNPGDQSNAGGDTVSLQLSATSPGSTMTYSASGLPGGLSLNSGTGLISGTLPSSDVSATPYSVTVTANDGTSSSSQTFAWTISAINLVSPGDQTNNDGDNVSLSLATAYHGSGTLSYSATGLPPGLSINSSTGQISGAIAGTADTNSPYAVTVTATDGTNTASQSFNWAVNPVVSIDAIDDQSNAAGDSVSVQVSASDALNNTLSYSATNLPSGLTINSTTGLISGTIAVGADSGSPYAVTVTATDSSGLSATQSFNWNVAHVSLVNPGPLQSNDGANVSLQLQGRDADGDTVNYTASGLLSGLSINTSTGLISGTIASNADTNSPYNVTVTASDGANTTTQTFLWTVGQVSLTAPSDQTNSEGDAVSLQLQGTASSGSLTYSASGLPNGLSLNPTTGLITGTIAAGDAANGPFTVDVAVTNGTDSTSQGFNWTVNPVVNLTAPAEQTNNEGNSVSLQVTATDALNKALTYSATGLPSGLSINSSTGLISGTIASGDASSGPYGVTVMASDGTYSSSAAFTWIVTHTDTTALTMTNPGTQTNVTADSVNVPINASDPDGIDSLTYSAAGLPDGMNIDPFSGLIYGIVADDAASTTPYQVTVTADDGNGQTVSQTFTWIVNAAPIAVQAMPVSAIEGNDTGPLTVATFTTPDLYSQAEDFIATIYWGDGTNDTTTVSGSNGSFTVSDDHTYAEKGTYTITVKIIDTVTGGTANAASTATVADGALNLTGGWQLGDPMTAAQNTFTLASFTDGNPNAQTSDYTVTINWGDGTQSTNDYVQNSGDGLLLIEAPHSYPNPLPMNAGPVTYTVTVQLTDVDGVSASTTSTVVVGNIVPGVQATMNNWAFVDENPNATVSDFVAGGQAGMAEINWGDGSSSLGTLGGSGGYFWVTGQHTYAQDSYDQPNGQYQITVTVTDVDGSTLTGTQYVSVVRPPVVLDTGYVEAPLNSPTLSNVQVAAFTVPDITDGQSEYSATINWGDGSSSGGTIQEVSPGFFQVTGSHTYGMGGFYPLIVEVYQGWSGMKVAAVDPDGAQAQPLPQITGPHVVLGFEAPGLADPRGHNYEYTVTVPGINLTDITPTFKGGPDSPAYSVYSRTSAIPNPAQNTTTINVKVKFSNSPVDLIMGLTYKPPGGGPVQTVQPLTVWVVQLSIAGEPQPALEKHPRFNPVYNRYVNVDTRGAPDYSIDNLKIPDTKPRPNVDTELAKGLVSFKATVIMKGPGVKNLDGVNLIKLGWVQTVTSNAVTIDYRRGSARFKPNPQVGPWLDSARNKPPYQVNPGTGGDTAFARSSMEQEPDGATGGGKKAVVVSLDAPGIGFLSNNPQTGAAWTRTGGVWHFSNNLAAYIDGQPTIYSWIGAVPWSVSFIGANNGAGVWVDTGSTVNIQTTINQVSNGRFPGLWPSPRMYLPFVTTTKEQLIGGGGEFNPLAPTWATATNGHKFTYSP